MEVVLKESTKTKISSSLKGRKHSNERVLAIKKGLAAEAKEARFARLEKMTLTKGGKPFILIDKNTNKIIYQGLLKEEICDKLQISKDHLKQVLKGVRKTIKGLYVAKYVDHIDPNLEIRQQQQKEKRKLQTRRYMLDLNNKLKRDLRSRLSVSIKGQKVYKTGSAIEDLGCSIEDLKKHLESKFQPGMTWDNHAINGWHIDHIIPLASFNLSDSEQLKKACHYANLQPLWALDNIKKSDNV